jgi:hypothetical protein
MQQCKPRSSLQQYDGGGGCRPILRMLVEETTGLWCAGHAGDLASTLWSGLTHDDRSTVVAKPSKDKAMNFESSRECTEDKAWGQGPWSKTCRGHGLTEQ